MWSYPVSGTFVSHRTRCASRRSRCSRSSTGATWWLTRHTGLRMRNQRWIYLLTLAQCVFCVLRSHKWIYIPHSHCEEWRCPSCHSEASTFLYCQDPSPLSGHIARMNESMDASRILFEPPSEVWRKPRRRPRNSWVRTVTNDLANSYTGLPEAREDAQDRVYWRMFTKHSTTHS